MREAFQSVVLTVRVRILSPQPFSGMYVMAIQSIDILSIIPIIYIIGTLSQQKLDTLLNRNCIAKNLYS